jgi:hypothetical protein
MRTRRNKNIASGYKKVTLEWVNLPHHGAQHLPFILELFSKHLDVFLDDAHTVEPTLEGKASFCLDTLEAMSGWVAVALADGVPFGVQFVRSWDGLTAEVGGVGKPKVYQPAMDEAFSQFIEAIFSTGKAELLRALTAEGNKAARVVLKRVGFNTPQPYRGYKVKNGEIINAIMLSLSKQEWSLSYGRSQEKHPSTSTSPA